MGFTRQQLASQLEQSERRNRWLADQLVDAQLRGDTYKAKTDARLLALYGSQKAVDRKNRRIHSLLKQVVELKTMDVLWSKKCEAMSSQIEHLARSTGDDHLADVMAITARARECIDSGSTFDEFIDGLTSDQMKRVIEGSAAFTLGSQRQGAESDGKTTTVRVCSAPARVYGDGPAFKALRDGEVTQALQAVAEAKAEVWPTSVRPTTDEDIQLAPDAQAQSEGSSLTDDPGDAEGMPQIVPQDLGDREAN